MQDQITIAGKSELYTALHFYQYTPHILNTTPQPTSGLD